MVPDAEPERVENMAEKLARRLGVDPDGLKLVKTILGRAKLLTLLTARGGQR